MRQSVSILNMHTRPTRTTMRQSMNILPLTMIQNRLITTSLVEHHAESRWQIPTPITEQRISSHQTAIRVIPTTIMEVKSSPRRVITVPNVLQTPLSLTSRSRLHWPVDTGHLLEQT